MIRQDGTKKQHGILYVLLMIMLLTGASVIGFLFRAAGFPETNIVVIYILSVLITAWLTSGFVYGILSSVLATFLFNYFFTEPYFTFSVYDPSYIITFIIMTVTALITSTITSHAKQSAYSARQKETETKAMYTLTNRLAQAKGIHEIACIAVSVISECFSCQAACLCFDADGSPEPLFVQQVSAENSVWRDAGDFKLEKKNISSGQSEYYVGTEFYDFSIHTGDHILGTVRIPKNSAEIMSTSQIHLLESMIENIALAMDRFWSAEQQLKSREEAVQERYRGNLLRAISHDLRTPLSGIMGTSEMLMDMTSSEDPRYALASGIHKDADWLHSMVENILSLTRLQEGKLILNEQMEAVEEVIAGAVEHISKRSPDYEITVSVPDELLLVPMDAKLIKQVLINLLDNAIKHTSPEQEISVSVARDSAKNMAIFMIKDGGSGISKRDLPHVFQMFYTSHSKHSDAKHGIGLGLAICDAIIKAHNGNIEAHNRSDSHGAEFVFTLPLEEQNDEPKL